MPGFLRVNHDNGQKANLPGRPFAGTSPFGSSVVEEILSLLAHTLGSEQRKCAICPGMKEREVGGSPLAGNLLQGLRHRQPVMVASGRTVFSCRTSSSGSTSPMEGHTAKIFVQVESTDRKRFGLQRLLDYFKSFP